MAKMTPLAVPSDHIMLICPAAAEDDRETAALKVVSLIGEDNITSISTELMNWCYIRRVPSESVMTQTAIDDIITMFTIFVAHGLDLNVRLRNNKTLLMHARRNGHTTLVEFLLSQGVVDGGTDEK